MARTKLTLAQVRVPIKLSRATALKTKFDDLDDYLDALKTTVYSAAGAISPTDGFAIIDSATPGMAMTLADGTINGETLNVIFRTKTGAGTVVITPANLASGTTWTLATAGQRGQLIWVSPDWNLRPGYGGVRA
jgi:hypothetical protein